MNIPCILFLSLLVVITLGFAAFVPLNPHAPLARDIQAIRHDENARQVIVALKPSRRCHRPTFRVRISGTSLLIMNMDSSEGDQLVYSYPPLLDNGAYFVEVLALFCTLFDPDHFVRMCLEDVADGSNIVTLPYTFHAAPNDTLTERRPRWVLATNQPATLLPTRYQKIGCMSEKSPFWCPAKSADIAQYNLYNWTDRPDYSSLLHQVFALSHNQTAVGQNFIRVCSIGDSHSRVLVERGNELGLENVKFIWILSAFPHDFDVQSLKIFKCSYAITAYGQWPASFKTNGNPYNQIKFTEEMRRVVTLLQNNTATNTQVFMRSVNYNSLGARQTSCPPVDYRSPPVIDMYNAVLRKLCKELNVEFIDLNHIMGPMWDSAEDWCHPESRVATAEIEWILFRIFRSTLQHKRSVELFSRTIYPDNSLIRFTDSPSVYLCHNDTLRVFPNGHTFMAMGFDFGDIRVLVAHQRAEFVFAADLPPM